MGGPDRHAAASRQIARLFQTTGERVISTFQAGQQAAGNAAPCRSHGTADCSCAVDSPPVLTAASWALQLSVSGQKVHPGCQTSWHEKDNRAQGKLFGMGRGRRCLSGTWRRIALGNVPGNPPSRSWWDRSGSWSSQCAPKLQAIESHACTCASTHKAVASR